MPDTALMTRRARHGLMQLALLLSLASAAAALSACGAADPVAEAAAATAQAGGAKVEMRIGFAAPGVPAGAAMTARGEIDTRDGDMQMLIDLGALGDALGASGQAGDPNEREIEMRVLDKVLYLRMGLLAQMLPSGKRWIRLDTREIGKSLGIGVDQMTQYSDPAKILDFLRASGDVEEVGRERLDDVDTTRYRATIDARRLLEEQRGPQGAGAARGLDEFLDTIGDSAIPADVWIDDDNLVRRMAIKMSMPGQSIAADVQLDLSDYGTEISVKAPPAAEVADGAGLLGAAGLTP